MRKKAYLCICFILSYAKMSPTSLRIPTRYSGIQLAKLKLGSESISQRVRAPNHGKKLLKVKKRHLFGYI
tara:strand:+ start:319 stop:528 length:210 start_codon:yes stop_codon:yes gene_type:complete